VDVLKKHNTRSVLTLHDFYYYCPNLGQKLFLGRYICRGKFPLKCMLCFRTSKINISKIDASIYSKFGHNSFLTEITKRIPSITYIVKGVRLLQRHPSFEEIIKRDIDLLGFLGKVDIIISPSMYYRRFYENLTGRRDIVYLDYGFDTKVTNTFNEKRTETERLILGFAGTISRHKGAHLIVKLAEKLGDRILIYIWGNDKNDLILSKRLKSLKNVIYKGELKGGDKSEIYGSIDYLIVPSIWEENSPLVIHEALLYNVPVIASNRGGNVELVLEGKNGFLFDPDKEDSLLRLIERIINEKIRISKVDRSVVMDIHSHTGILRDRYYLKQDIEKSPS
jgi:glycosyltransferase involved in cell wall biosynthesis